MAQVSRLLRHFKSSHRLTEVTSGLCPQQWPPVQVPESTPAHQELGQEFPILPWDSTGFTPGDPKVPHFKGLWLQRGQREKEAASYITRSAEGWGRGMRGEAWTLIPILSLIPMWPWASPFPSLGLNFPAQKGRCLATSPRIPSLLQETHAQTALARTPAISRPWWSKVFSATESFSMGPPLLSHLARRCHTSAWVGPTGNRYPSHSSLIKAYDSGTASHSSHGKETSCFWK